MTTELQFAVIKDELTAMVDDIIRQFLNDKDYDQNQAQSWCNGISDEIIKALHQQQRGFKFVCNSTIFQKGDASLHFSSTCLLQQHHLPKRRCLSPFQLYLLMESQY